MPLAKEYLGDSVYIQIDSVGRIVLTTEDGLSISNTIYIDQTIMRGILDYLEKLSKEK